MTHVGKNSGTTEAKNKGTHPAATPLLKIYTDKSLANSWGSPSNPNLSATSPILAKLAPMLAMINYRHQAIAAPQVSDLPFMCSKSILVATVF